MASGREDIIKAGEIFEILVADHLVIGQDAFVSLRGQKLGFGD